MTTTLTSHAHAVYDMLDSVPASAFAAPADVVKLEACTTYRRALEILDESNVSSAPVFVDEISTDSPVCAALLPLCCYAIGVRVRFWFWVCVYVRVVCVCVYVCMCVCVCTYVRVYVFACVRV